MKIEGFGIDTWAIEDDGIVVSYKREIFIENKALFSVKLVKDTSSGLVNGKVEFGAVYNRQREMYVCEFPYKMRNQVMDAINMLREKYIIESVHENEKLENVVINNNKIVSSNGKIKYSLDGARGRHIDVYEDKCVIKTKVSVGSIITGNATDGEKTIYYVDCVGVQFKEAGLTLGYLQFETASTMMNNKSNNFFNENSFTYDTPQISNNDMKKVADYVKERIDEVKRRGTSGGQVINQVSGADEILKYKNLLDMGIISQEEFEAKKKQILGI